MFLLLILAVLLAPSTLFVLKIDNAYAYKHFDQNLWPNLETSGSYLKHAILSRNIKHINNADSDFTLRNISCSFIIENTDIVANCSNKNITYTSQLNNVPSTITGLDLSFNSLQDISNNSLARFTQLKWLNISNNLLQQLNGESFQNLSLLTALLLQSNNLAMTSKTFPDNVFAPLVSLKQLWMYDNNRVHNHSNLNYPDAALGKLHNLGELYIDGLPNKPFGHGFSLMKSLNNLIMNGVRGGYCSLQSLGNNTFINLVHLTSLSLIYCNISGHELDPLVFVPLKELVYLDLSGNDNLELDNLSVALSNLNESKIKVLNISNIINPYFPGIKIKEEFAKSLPRNLDELVATSNAIEVLEAGVLESLPKSLRILNVGDNKFAFMSYLKDLDKLENLQTLTLSGGLIFDLPRYYPPETYEPVLFEKFEKDDVEKRDYLTQALPPKLEVLNIVNAGWSNYLTQFHFNDSNNLTTLNLSYNNFPALIGPITGLNFLKELNLFGCRISQIQDTFFQNLSTIQRLNLGTNYFGRNAFTTNESIFNYLPNLRILDLNFTDIRDLSYNTFKPLINLEVLYLQRNPLADFYVDISHMTNLRHINLSMTDLVTIEPEMTKMFDGLSSNLTIDLSKNTFQCFCSNLDFIGWMITSKAISNTTIITCSFVNGARKDLSMSELAMVYKALKRECTSNFKLYAIVVCATILLTVAIIVAIAYNFRLKLQYIYYSIVLHFKTENRNNFDEHFQYDVFISYAHEDQEFVMKTLCPQLQLNDLKIHIHGLHFTAGDLISSNIVNAVNNSRRTLVVLTQNHINSKWSKFEVEMANMRQVHTGRVVLIFLIMEEVTNLTTQLMYHLKKNTYIRFPKTQSNQREIKAFWSKLVSDLKS